MNGSTNPPPMPLGMLTGGQTAEVADLVGSAEQVHRLEEIGLRRGIRVEMVRAGSPCIVRLDGNKLCIRESELFGVLVQQKVVE